MCEFIKLMHFVGMILETNNRQARQFGCNVFPYFLIQHLSAEQTRLFI